jgi:hypothetical protein
MIELSIWARRLANGLRIYAFTTLASRCVKEPGVKAAVQFQ